MAPRQTSILNVESDMTPISATYYEWNADGLPIVQRRRGDYDVDHEYVYDDVPRQIGESIKEPDGRHSRFPVPPAPRRSPGPPRLAAGGLRSMQWPDQLTYYEFNAANQLVTSQHYDGSWAYFSYDADGNTTTVECPSGGDAGPQGTTYYSWNQDNLMVEATVPGVATTNEFEWNAAQQRTKKTDTDGTAYLLRDGQKIVAERTTGDVLRARYANEGSSLYSFLLSDTRNASTVWPTYDMLGTVQSVLNSSATVTGSSLREAFGTSQGTSGTLPGPFGYVGALGYYHDQDLAMPLLSIRHYAMGRGMFVARDPVLTEPRYGYVGGRPTVGTDPTGLWDDICWGGYDLEFVGIFAYAAVRLHVWGQCTIRCPCKAWTCRFDVVATASGALLGFLVGLGGGGLHCDIFRGVLCDPSGGWPLRPFMRGDTFSPGAFGVIVQGGGLYARGTDVFCAFGGLGLNVGGFSASLVVGRDDWSCVKHGAPYSVIAGNLVPGMEPLY